LIGTIGDLKLPIVFDRGPGLDAGDAHD
jgi:hypothetical protein